MARRDRGAVKGRPALSTGRLRYPCPRRGTSHANAVRCRLVRPCVSTLSTPIPGNVPHLLTTLGTVGTPLQSERRTPALGHLTQTLDKPGRRRAGELQLARRGTLPRMTESDMSHTPVATDAPTTDNPPEATVTSLDPASPELVGEPGADDPDAAEERLDEVDDPDESDAAWQLLEDTYAELGGEAVVEWLASHGVKLGLADRRRLTR